MEVITKIAIKAEGTHFDLQSLEFSRLGTHEETDTTEKVICYNHRSQRMWKTQYEEADTEEGSTKIAHWIG